MPEIGRRFALNHMVCPGLDPAAFFGLASGLGIASVEIRNDLAGNAILGGMPAAQMRALADAAGIRILSINALQRFDDWTPARADEATALAAYARTCGAEALVLVPCNDGSRPGGLAAALRGLQPILAAAGVTGLIEPLGFATSSLRLKADAVAAIDAVEARATFRLVHDTFHHALSGEPRLYPDRTGLVHVSGVSDPRLAIADMRDAHRGLVDADDRLDNVGQVNALLAGGYDGAISFEPFAPAVHALTDPTEAIRRSMARIADGAADADVKTKGRA